MSEREIYNRLIILTERHVEALYWYFKLGTRQDLIAESMRVLPGRKEGYKHHRPSDSTAGALYKEALISVTPSPSSSYDINDVRDYLFSILGEDEPDWTKWPPPEPPAPDEPQQTLEQLQDEPPPRPPDEISIPIIDPTPPPPPPARSLLSSLLEEINSLPPAIRNILISVAVVAFLFGAFYAFDAFGGGNAVLQPDPPEIAEVTETVAPSITPDRTATNDARRTANAEMWMTRTQEAFLTGTSTFTPTPTPTPVTPTSTPTDTPTLTNTPTETPSPLPSLTPTATNVPILGAVGSQHSDGSVTLTLLDYKFPPDTRYQSGAIRVNYAMDFKFDFLNHSGEEVFFGLDVLDFDLVDNNGRDYHCELPIGQRHIPLMPLAAGQSREFSVACGRSNVFTIDVTRVVLIIRRIPILPSSDWIFEIQG